MMRIALALMTLLAMQVSQESPDGTIRKALEKDRREAAVVRSIACGHVTAKTELNTYGFATGPATILDPNEPPKFNISVQKFLKTGRYVYRSAGTISVQEGVQNLVSFTPAANDQLEVERDLETSKLTLQDKILNWVLNKSQGIITIDQATGGIRRIEAWTIHEESYGKIVAHLYSFRLVYKQQQVRGVWAPDRVSSRMSFHVNKLIANKFFGILDGQPDHFEEYDVVFSCKTSPPEP